jgi:predicted nucleotidyltransferase
MIESNRIKQGFSEVPLFFREYLEKFLMYLKKRVKKDLISVILYGSVARDTWNTESDLDLLVILSHDFHEENGDYRISKILIDFYDNNRNTEIFEKYKFHSLQILSLNINEIEKLRTIFYDIAMDGIILYDPKNIGLRMIKIYLEQIEKKNLKRIYVSKNDFYWKRKDVKFGERIEL